RRSCQEPRPIATTETTQPSSAARYASDRPVRLPPRPEALAVGSASRAAPSTVAVPANPLIMVEPESWSTTTELSASPTATPTPPRICAAESTAKVLRWTARRRAADGEASEVAGALVTREVSHNPRDRLKRDLSRARAL